MDFSLNVTAIMLFITSVCIIGGSSICIFITGLGPSNDVSVASCNLASLVGISVGFVLMQVDLNKKNKEIHRLRVFSPMLHNNTSTIVNIPEL